MKLYSQRDIRWAKEKIGNTNSTIGQYGCTITCIAMLAEITPSEVNKRMTRVGGYLRDLVIWEKINEAIPWLSNGIRARKYENNKVTQAISDNGGCLVEVDFDGVVDTPNDEHWVLFVGNKTLYDPWTGTVKDTNHYPVLKGYTIINLKDDMDEKIYTEDEMTVVREARDENWNLYQKEKEKVGEIYGVLGVKTQEEALKELQDLEPIILPDELQFGDETGTKAKYDENGVLLGYEKTYKPKES